MASLGEKQKRTRWVSMEAKDSVIEAIYVQTDSITVAFKCNNSLESEVGQGELLFKATNHRSHVDEMG